MKFKLWQGVAIMAAGLPVAAFACQPSVTPSWYLPLVVAASGWLIIPLGLFVWILSGKKKKRGPWRSRVFRGAAIITFSYVLIWISGIVADGFPFQQVKHYSADPGFCGHPAYSAYQPLYFLLNWTIALFAVGLLYLGFRGLHKKNLLISRRGVAQVRAIGLWLRAHAKKLVFALLLLLVSWYVVKAITAPRVGKLPEDDRITAEHVVTVESNFNFGGNVTLRVSANGEHIAAKYSGLYIDGQKVSEHCCSYADVVFDETGEHYAYTENKYEGKLDSAWPVVDGAAGEIYGMVANIAFVPGTSEVVYRVHEENDRGAGGGRMAWVFGEKREAWYANVEKSNIYPSLPHFSEDGSRHAYAATRSSGRNPKWFAVIDGEEGPSYEAVDGLVFSPNGEHVAYRARRAADEWVVVLDGEEQASFGSVSDPKFSADSNHLIYTAHREREMAYEERFVVIDGESVSDTDVSHHFINDPAPVVFNPRDNSFAYVAQVELIRQRVVAGSIAGKTYDSVGIPMYSSDGATLTYSAVKDRDSDEWFVVVNEKEYGPYHEGANPKIEPGLLTGSSDSLNVGRPAFYSTENHLAYRAGRKSLLGTEEFLVIDGVEHKAYDAVGLPKYTDDGKHYAYEARLSDNSGMLVVDGEEAGDVWEDIFGPTFVQRDGELVLVYGARKGQEIWKVTRVIER